MENLNNFTYSEIIPVRPITLLYGKCNSGKSLILKSIRDTNFNNYPSIFEHPGNPTDNTCPLIEMPRSLIKRYYNPLDIYDVLSVHMVPVKIS